MNRVWTVAKLNNYISGLIEDDPAFAPQIVVEGNVSLGPKGYSRFSHIYFTLIDPDDPAPDYQKAKLSCAMWKSTVERGGLTYEMKNGDNIRVTGRIAVYGARSQYQLIATRIENAGAGKLEEAKKALFNELRARGYFEADHKKPIPAYITRVGIVTSPTGEAVHDIIRNIQLRNPFLSIHPSVLAHTDGTSHRVNVTTRLKYTHENKMMYAGLGYSPSNSVTVLIGGIFHGITLGYSYEMYTSVLKIGNGSHELFVGYQTDLNFQKKGRNRHQSVRIL